jgi:DNA polymerase III epsilon subunit-like protein
MRRYEITNKQNGLKFGYESETALPHQPEWGVDPEIVITDIIAEVEAIEAEKLARKNAIKNIDNVTTIAGLKAVIKALLKELRMDQ